MSCWNVELLEYRNLFLFVCYFIAMITTHCLPDCKARLAAGFRNSGARTHSAPGPLLVCSPLLSSFPLPPPPRTDQPSWLPAHLGGSGSLGGGERAVSVIREESRRVRGRWPHRCLPKFHIQTSFHPSEVRSVCLSDLKRQMTILLLLSQKFCFEVNSYIWRKKSSEGWVQW